MFCLQLNYPNQTREIRRYDKRRDEIKFLQGHGKRNRFICNLACDLKGNILLPAMNIEHGKVLYNLISDKEKDVIEKQVFMSAGASNQEDEEIRSYIQKNDGWIVISSYKKTGFGFPVHVLDHVILSTPYKNEMKNLKPIGSGLKARNGTCNLYDLMDDLRLEGWENFRNNLIGLIFLKLILCTG